jgi:hypothetical protein
MSNAKYPRLKHPLETNMVPLHRGGATLETNMVPLHRGGATLEPGCAAAHSDFLKNQRNFFFFYIDILN